jgi:hypothetical protein
MTLTLTPTAPRTVPIRRVGWGVLAMLLLALAVVEVVQHHLGPWPILAFVMAPDLSFLASAGAAVEHGRLSPRAVPMYNAVHRPTVPMALIALASLDLIPLFWLVAGLSWLTHIAVDRASGYGLRTKDGWQRG